MFHCKNLYFNVYFVGNGEESPETSLYQQFLAAAVPAQKLQKQL